MAMQGKLEVTSERQLGRKGVKIIVELGLEGEAGRSSGKDKSIHTCSNEDLLRE